MLSYNLHSNVLMATNFCLYLPVHCHSVPIDLKLLFSEQSALQSFQRPTRPNYDHAALKCHKNSQSAANRYVFYFAPAAHHFFPKPLFDVRIFSRQKSPDSDRPAVWLRSLQSVGDCVSMQQVSCRCRKNYFTELDDNEIRKFSSVSEIIIIVFLLLFYRF